jgi:hypothetical protein
MAKKKDNITKENVPSVEIMDERFDRFLEEAKLTNDYMKHIATLDTGSILIMVAFLNKPLKPGAEIIVFLAAFAFITSLTGVVMSQRAMVNYVSDARDDVKKIPIGREKNAYRIAHDAAFFFFLLAIGILLGFILYTMVS